MIGIPGALDLFPNAAFFLSPGKEQEGIARASNTAERKGKEMETGIGKRRGRLVEWGNEVFKDRHVGCYDGRPIRNMTGIAVLLGLKASEIYMYHIGTDICIRPKMSSKYWPKMFIKNVYISFREKINIYYE